MAHIDYGDYEGAIEFLDRALALYPTYEDAINKKAQVEELLAAGDTEEEWEMDMDAGAPEEGKELGVDTTLQSKSNGLDENYYICSKSAQEVKKTGKRLDFKLPATATELDQ